MRVLLIAYEYPPIESAQALRWHYLGRELVAAGVELTVLTADLAPASFRNPGSAKVIRTWPGPFVGLSAWLARRGGLPRSAAATPAGEGLPVKVYQLTRALLNHIVFPDVRTEWYPFARRAGRKLDAGSFDAVIASHEPGVDLMLGISTARRLGVPLFIDLGDPLVTPYTPRWRRRLDRWLEGRACRLASGIITTTARFNADLAARYRLDPRKLTVIEQGFDSSEQAEDNNHPPLPSDRFWLFYSGNFYRDFRNPDRFFRALGATPGACLVYAGHTPGWLLEMIKPVQEQVICLGRIPHRQALALQRRAPMLLSIGNVASNQLPGKLYEYLGAQRPILHLAHGTDEAKGILDQTARGICVDNAPKPIAAVLRELRQNWKDGTLDGRWNLEPSAAAPHSWLALGRRLADFLRERVDR